MGNNSDVIMIEAINEAIKLDSEIINTHIMLLDKLEARKEYSIGDFNIFENKLFYLDNRIYTIFDTYTLNRRMTIAFDIELYRTDEDYRFHIDCNYSLDDLAGCIFWRSVNGRLDKNYIAVRYVKNITRNFLKLLSVYKSNDLLNRMKQLLGTL